MYRYMLCFFLFLLFWLNDDDDDGIMLLFILVMPNELRPNEKMEKKNIKEMIYTKSFLYKYFVIAFTLYSSKSNLCNT